MKMKTILVYSVSFFVELKKLFDYQKRLTFKISYMATSICADKWLMYDNGLFV